MAWFSGKVSLGNFPDLAGAVNKLSESVKNIEKNFDTALGFEEKSDSVGEASGLWPSASDRKALFDPVMAFMGHKSGETAFESLEKAGEENAVESPEKAVEKSAVDSAEKAGERSAVESQEKAGETSAGESKEKAGERRAVESQEKAGERRAVESQEKVGERNAVESQEKAGERSAVESQEKAESSELSSSVEDKEAVEVDRPSDSAIEQPESVGEQDEVLRIEKDHVLPTAAMADPGKALSDANPMSPQPSESIVQNTEATESLSLPKEKESSEVGSSDSLPVTEAKSGTDEVDLVEARYVADQLQSNVDLRMSTDEQKTLGMALDSVSSLQAEAVESQATVLSDTYDTHHAIIEESKNDAEFSKTDFLDTLPSAELVFQENDVVAKSVEVNQLVNHSETSDKEQRLNSGAISNSADFSAELEKVKKEMKMMETALQGAARQAQAKADEIAKLMNENEQLKAVTEDLRRKSNDAEIELLREEYHQRVATLERKVYALTKERDTLRREQSKKSDAAALLKEKDEIINQVMAEGEELSKKQAAQESQIRKLRAQVRELEEEKKGLTTKLQVEENKVDSIKRDKAATEKLLQETIERSQAELAAQKEFYTNALSAAKEAEALAEARANDEARTELESRLREAEEREAMLVQALEELRQTLSQKEQQAVFREDMLRRDIEDLQKRYQASERRCEELITQVPESTRPLLRQIEAMQETTARRAEAWAAVERSLNSRLQEAEARAAAAEERERSINERLTQTLSRINVLEAQISCLRTEQTQLTRSLEKERHRAAENRQEYLAAKEEADTQEGRANQLDEEIKELRRKHKQDLQEAIAQQELLQQEIEREKTARLDLERTSRLHSSIVPDQPPLSKQSSAFDNGILPRKLSSASSLSSMEESYFLQASLDSSDGFSERRTPAETTMSPYYMKSMTPSTFEASLRQKEGELASYMSRLASLESIRDSLAEELVKMTAQCEKLRVEAATLPGMRAELEALRRRHSAALELMGERDEELEELRNDIVDLKEMYREQVNLLVNKIQILSSSMSTT